MVNRSCLIVTVCWAAAIAAPVVAQAPLPQGKTPPPGQLAPLFRPLQNARPVMPNPPTPTPAAPGTMLPPPEILADAPQTLPDPPAAFGSPGREPLWNPTPPAPAIDLNKIKRDLLNLKAARAVISSEREEAARAIATENSSTAQEMAGLKARLTSTLATLDLPKAEGEAVPSEEKLALNLEKLKRKAAELSGSRPAPLTAAETVDPVGLGQALFRSGNYEGALTALRQVDLTGLQAEDRVPVRYLIATCLKKQGKLDEAAGIYREVANSRGDPIMAEAAQWQLRALHWLQDVNNQFNTLRQRKAALESVE